MRTRTAKVAKRMIVSWGNGAMRSSAVSFSKPPRHRCHAWFTNHRNAGGWVYGASLTNVDGPWVGQKYSSSNEVCWEESRWGTTSSAPSELHISRGGNEHDNHGIRGITVTDMDSLTLS